MTVTPISLRKSLGKKEYNSFLNKFLIGGLMQTLRDTASYELSVEQAKELGDLVKRSRFTVKETYRDDVHEGLGVVVTINFENGYTLSSFGKFLRKNTDKLKSAGIVEDFLSSKGYRGVPKSYHSIELGRDLAFRSSELIDVAREENGKRAVPKKEKVIKAIARYGIIEPDDEIRKTLKEDNYQTYFKETFFDKLENTSGLEHIVTEFEAFGASLDRQKKSIIHNDLHRNNILKARDKSSSTKIIDWDDAAIGAIQKDLFRVNMSVHYNNCLDHSEEREASIKALYDALDSAMRDSGKEHPDSFETFRKNYLIADVLENLNFSAKSLALSKKLAKKGDDDNAIFYKELTDLLYTRALDSLNESGEKELEVKLQYLGEKNSIVRLSREDRIQCEKEQPDKHVGSLRAQLELSDEVIDEQRRLFNQAVNRRNLKSIAKKGFLATTTAAGILGLLSYAASKYLMPAIDVWKARSFISVKAEDKEHDETNEVMNARPEEIEMINNLHPNLNEWMELEKNTKAKRFMDEYNKRRDKAYQTIDSVLSNSKPWHRKHLLTENILTPEEKQAITDEYLAIIFRVCDRNNDPFIEIIREQMAEPLQTGLFSPSMIREFDNFKDTHIGVELVGNKGSPQASEAAKVSINSPEAFVKFFTEHSTRPELIALLQQAYEKHNNSLAVKNEKLKALPPGTIDALIFAEMLKQNCTPYNLNKYLQSLGHSTELLVKDEFRVGYLASYVADMLRKHQDIATVFAICTNGELDVQDAMTCSGSTNFFEYKHFLKDKGEDAELVWFYFARKNMNMDPRHIAAEFELYDDLRSSQKDAMLIGAMGRQMENTVQVMRNLLDKHREFTRIAEEATKESIMDVTGKLSETKENFEFYDSLNEKYIKYAKDPGFCQEYSEEAAEIRALLPTLQAIVDYERVQLIWGEAFCRSYTDMKSLSPEQIEIETDRIRQMSKRQEAQLKELESRLDPDKVKAITGNSERLIRTIKQYEQK